MRWKRITSATVLVLAPFLLVAACGESAFERKAGSAAAEMAAASSTLKAVHQGRMPARYAKASFANFDEQLSGVSDELAMAPGAPKPDRLKALLELTKKAEQAVGRPCLDQRCDWVSQSRDLDSAAAALRDASGG
jgi:hypothetical protein